MTDDDKPTTKFNPGLSENNNSDLRVIEESNNISTKISNSKLKNVRGQQSTSTVTKNAKDTTEVRLNNRAVTNIQGYKTDKREKNREEVRKVLILADEQGNKVRELLQDLLSETYKVVCYRKPGATMNTILGNTSNDIVKLTNDDFVIVLGGVNDSNPYDLTQNLHHSLKQTVVHTNVIVCEVPFTRQLRETKLNYELKYACNKYKFTFLDFNYSKIRPMRSHYAINLARSLLRDILRITNLKAYDDYVKHLLNMQKLSCLKVDKCTQTDQICNVIKVPVENNNSRDNDVEDNVIEDNDFDNNNIENNNFGNNDGVIVRNNLFRP